MYSKSLRFAMLVAAMLCAACSITVPVSDEPPVSQETNLALVMRNNLLYIPSLTVDGRGGSFLFGSANATSVVDPRFAAVGSHTLQLNTRESWPFTAVAADLHDIGDAIIGADVWGQSAVTVDYRVGLLTEQPEGIHPGMMTTYQYAAEPMINVTVDGHRISAIVDTASPDTLVLPAAATARRNAHVEIAGVDFGTIDIREGGTAAPRVGNRLLSKFLVTIDYGRHIVGLWRDPRIRL